MSNSNIHLENPCLQLAEVEQSRTSGTLRGYPLRTVRPCRRPASQASGLGTQTDDRSAAPGWHRANPGRRHRARAAWAGLTFGMDELLIGQSGRGPIRLSVADRRLHAAVFGQTGTGKTTLLKSLILQDIEAGRGCMVLDPHGDLAEDLLEHIPRRRTDDVCYFDPANLARAAALNPLAAVPPDERHRVTEEVVAVFAAIWGLSPAATPRLLHLLTNAIAALLDLPNGASLVGLPRLLSDRPWREHVVKHVTKPQVRAFWEREFAAWPERQQLEATAAVLNKAEMLVASPALYNTLGQISPTIRPERLMDEGRVVIANLSKGRLGETSAHLLGALLLAAFDLAARRRAAVPEAERRDFVVYADEFQAFAGERVASVLSEARKYRLALVLAAQFTAQMPEAVRAALFGNVGTVITFRVGPDDADELGRLLGWSPQTLRDLSRGEIIARTVARGEPRDAVLGRTAPVAVVRVGGAINIRSQSSQRYTRARCEVEARLLRWFDGTR